MSQKKDIGNPEVIEFEDLETEEETSSKEEQLAVFLKDKLSEEDFGAAAKILGVEGTDLSNAELLEKLTELLEGAKAMPPKKEPPKEEEEEEEKDMMADYKAFMRDCMAEGKTMEDCQAEFKKKHPEPVKKEEEAGPEDLAKTEDDKDLAKLNDRITELEGKLELEEISNEVSGLVQAKHL